MANIFICTDFVHPNVPCIIKGAISSKDTLGHLTLTLDDIIHLVGEDINLTVDVTPDGHGDCIRSVMREDGDNKSKPMRMFVKPYEERMGIGRFRDMLRRQQECDYTVGNSADIPAEDTVSNIDSNGLQVLSLHHNTDYSEECNSLEKDTGVVYYSRQNDCLRTEVAKLFSTKIFPETFPFAEQAFGTGPPDAVNLWIGNEKSTSSMHKDHYENLFYVCSGQKEFILCPPADIVFLHEDSFSSGTCRPVGGDKWVVVPDDSIDDGDEGQQKWIEPDIKRSLNNSISSSKFPLLSKAHPISVLVSEGEMLYIPSLWYHRVSQTCETVGVNYWFDMKFDSPGWCYFNLLQNLKKL